MKILVITNRISIPAIEADSQDRLEGIKQLRRLGFDVRVIGKCFDFQDKNVIERFSKENDIPIYLIPYKFAENKSWTRKILSVLKRSFNPAHWDGAAYEYSQTATKKAVEKVTEEWKPDAALFDSTFLWPLYYIFQKRKIPIITRSLAFEANQYLKAGGLHYLRFIFKSLSEIITVRKSDLIFVLTPDEEKIYEKIGAKGKMARLPLRSLSKTIAASRIIREKNKLNVFFSGSSYAYLHNRRALEFILQDIIPLVTRGTPEKFIFHITGKKLSPELNKYFKGGVVYHGLVDDYEKFLENMDIALAPLLLGTGMQQKIFEPLCRGIPTITSYSGLAGYPFKNGEHLLLAETPKEFADNLIKLQNTDLRKKISKNSIELCRKLFSNDALDRIILDSLLSVYPKRQTPFS